MAAPSILSDYLAALGVPHTQWYADKAFASMTFKSLFGLSKVLESYGVPGEALEVSDKKGAIEAFPVPFLARMNTSFVIVTDIGRGDGGKVSFRDGISEGISSLPVDDFCRRWTGVLFVGYPNSEASEPDYAAHRFTEIGNRCKKWVLAAVVAFLFLYFFITNGIYSHVSTVLLVLISAAGLFVSYQLLLKSLHIHTAAGDSICGVIDRTGCNTVLDTSAAKFFGLFGWSEVGFAYFSVTSVTLVAFPQCIGWLALINACCCPFSFWSVWYQKYRAKAWCTMCLIVQACLWLSLACYICGGYFHHLFPLRAPLFVLGACYVAVLLGLNALTPVLDRQNR